MKGVGLRVKKQIVFKVEPKIVSMKHPCEQGALSLLSHVFCVPNAEFTKSQMLSSGLCISGVLFCSRFFTHNLQANRFTSGKPRLKASMYI
jgi:hypothetical protein